MPPPVLHSPPTAVAGPRLPPADLAGEACGEVDDSARPERLGRMAEALALRLGMGGADARQLRLAAPWQAGGDGPQGLAAEVARHRRERWDGSGYPQGLRGEAIPLNGRIAAIVEYFDGLSLPCCYRPARADDRALAMLAELAGSAFDPAVVAVFIAHATELIALRDRRPAGPTGDCA